MVEVWNKFSKLSGNSFFEYCCLFEGHSILLVFQSEALFIRRYERAQFEVATKTRAHKYAEHHDSSKRINWKISRPLQKLLPENESTRQMGDARAKVT